MLVFETRINLTSGQYQQIFNELVGQRFRPGFVIGYGLGGPPLFAVIFVPAGGNPFQAFHDLTSIQYQQTFDAMIAQGYRPRVVSGYDGGGQPLFAAFFEQTGGPPVQACHNLTSVQFQQTFDEMVGQGYQPSLINGYAVSGQPLFAAIFE
jgi:Polyglycine hydrolase-like, structural repeat